MLRICLVCFLSLISMTAWSQVKHLVFNIEGTLVQAIPARNYEAFSNKDQMIKVEVGSKTRYYYIYPNVSYLLHYLQNKNPYVIHFMTNQNNEWAQTVLKAITLPKPIQASLWDYLVNSNLNKLFTDVTKNTLDLKLITSDLKNVTLITTFPDLLLPEQKANEFLLSQSFYYFETWAQAQAELNKNEAATKIHLPQTEEEWLTEQNKMAYIFQILQDSKAAKSKNLLADLQRLTLNPVAMTQRGLSVARYKFEEKVQLFKYNADNTKVIGCGIFDPLLDKFIQDIDLNKCLNHFSIKYSYRFNQAAYKVETCEMRDEATGAFIKEAKDMSKCFEGSKSNIKYYWAGKARLSCGAYLNDMFLQMAPDKNCSFYHLLEVNGKRTVSVFFEVNGELTSMIPEIFDLSPGQTLPATIYDSYDSKVVGLSLIQWIILNREKSDLTEETPDYNFMDDTRIMMAFNFTDFDKIQTSCFLNQHRSGSSHGAFNPTIRSQREDIFLNLNLESSYGSQGAKVNDVRPKYSYFFLDKYRADMGLSTVSFQYGNVFAKFKEQVKLRATFTPGDSLDINAQAKDVRTMFYKSADKVTLTRGGYWETQIWGTLCLDEVEYFVVNCTTPISEENIQTLKATGLPVYDCHPSYSSGSSYPYNLTKRNLL
jgi:hypothetical protein